MYPLLRFTPTSLSQQNLKGSQNIVWKIIRYNGMFPIIPGWFPLLRDFPLSDPVESLASISLQPRRVPRCSPAILEGLKRKCCLHSYHPLIHDSRDTSHLHNCKSPGIIAAISRYI